MGLWECRNVLGSCRLQKAFEDPHASRKNVLCGNAIAKCFRHHERMQHF
eukprot:gene6334-6986_t